MADSSIPKFFEKTRKERLEILKKFANLSEEDAYNNADQILAINEASTFLVESPLLSFDGFAFLVDTYSYCQLLVFLTQQGIVRERFKSQPVRSVGGIGNQFPQKNFLVAVQRMNHKLQQLLHFGLKTKGLGFGHDRLRTPKL